MQQLHRRVYIRGMVAGTCPCNCLLEGGGGDPLQSSIQEGSVQGLTPYTFVYHFDRKAIPFVYL